MSSRFSSARFGFLPELVALVRLAIPLIALRVGNNLMQVVDTIVAGRISPEKGIDTLLEAARRLPDIPFRLAGNVNGAEQSIAAKPANVELTGHLNHQALVQFHRSSRAMVACSRCFEGFPVMFVEAMFAARPVISSRIGGLPEVVEHDRTGLLFTPDNVDELVDHIRSLWDSPDLCRRLGQSGFEKARQMYGKQQLYNNLLEVYDRAQSLVGVRPHSSRRIAA